MASTVAFLSNSAICLFIVTVVLLLVSDIRFILMLITCLHGLTILTHLVQFGHGECLSGLSHDRYVGPEDSF